MTQYRGRVTLQKVEDSQGKVCDDMDQKAIPAASSTGAFLRALIFLESAWAALVYCKSVKTLCIAMLKVGPPASAGSICTPQPCKHLQPLQHGLCPSNFTRIHGAYCSLWSILNTCWPCKCVLHCSPLPPPCLHLAADPQRMALQQWAFHGIWPASNARHSIGCETYCTQ